MNVTQVRKSLGVLVTELEQLYNALPTDKLESIMEKMEDLKGGVEEVVDRLNDRERLSEADEERLSKYEEVFSLIEDTISELESFKDAIDSIEDKKGDIDTLGQEW